MKVKIFQIDDSLEQAINKWLATFKEDQAIDDIAIGNGIVIVTYDSSWRRKRRRKAADKGPSICRQCRKRLAVEGKKSCAECLEYQRKYREDKKREKDERTYLP